MPLSSLPVAPVVEPMLAEVSRELPDHASTDVEANWNGLLSLLWAAFP